MADFDAVAKTIKWLSGVGLLGGISKMLIDHFRATAKIRGELEAVFFYPRFSATSGEMLDAHIMLKVRIVNHRHGEFTIGDWSLEAEYGKSKFGPTKPLQIPKEWQALHPSVRVHGISVKEHKETEHPLVDLSEHTRSEPLKYATPVTGWLNFVVTGCDSDEVRERAVVTLKARDSLGKSHRVLKHQKEQPWPPSIELIEKP